MRKNIDGFNGPALVMGVFAVCCGGPLLIGALAATGLGAWVLGSGGSAIAGIGLIAIAIAIAALWLRQRGWRPIRRRAADCCAPTAASRSEVKS